MNQLITYLGQGLYRILMQMDELKVELSGTGDLWYYGLPLSIDKKEYNSGKLIDKTNNFAI